MTKKQQNIFYYITMMNESYQQPTIPQGMEDDIIKNMYLLEENKKETAHHVQLLNSGTILREVVETTKILHNKFNIGTNI